MSLCSVIIVTKQGGAILFTTIESVLQQEQLAELIIVDNGNAPAVVARLQQRSLSEPRLKIISGRGDINFAKGCNIAARQAAGKYLAMVKPGYLLPPDALSGLVKALETEPKAMVSGGLVELHDGAVHTNPRVKIITPKTIFFDVMRFIPGKPGSAAATGKMIEKNSPFESATVSSSCICVRASDYKKLGGLDDEFYPQDEEVDFCLRAQQIGGRVFCVPAVRVTRLPYVNDERVSGAQLLREAKNTVRYLNKFFSAHQPFGTLFVLNILIMLRVALKIIAGGVLEVFQGAQPRSNSISAKRLMILALGSVSVPRNEQLAKKIVLVTGATSQIGLCVVRRLIAAGAAVLAVSRNDEIPYRHAHLRWLKGDLTDHAMDLDGYCVDAVVHCAPLWHLPPLVGMLQDAEAKRIIAFSSTSVFAKLLSANDFEKDLVGKLQGAENFLVEKCQEYGIRYTIFRPTLIYGVGLDVGITSLAKFIRRFGGVFVYPPAFGRRQPVHVDDLAVAVVQAMDNENSYDKSYNLSGGEVLTYREMLVKIFNLYGKKPRIINSTMLPFLLDVIGRILRKKHVNGEIARRMNDDLVFFHDEAKRDFGYNPRNFLVGGIKDIEGF